VNVDPKKLEVFMGKMIGHSYIECKRVMKAALLTVLAMAGVATLVQAAGQSAQVDKDALQGVWVAKSMESDGKPVPPEEVNRIRFTFRGDKLLMQGNFKDDREEECGYKIDPKSSPKQLDVIPPMVKQPILGIYEVKGDELKVCLRHASSSEGRPTEFATKQDSRLILIVLQKQKP
jgi:uncharacterized protein (TIGR03067 family)